MLSAQPQLDTTSPVTASAVFDPPVVRPGETTTYRVVLNAMKDAIQWPEEIIAPQALEFRASARGQILANTGASLQPRTTFNYRVSATAAGTFAVPRYLVYVNGIPITVPEATVEARTDLAAPVPPSEQLLFRIPVTNLFIGQRARAEVLLPANTAGVVQAMAQVDVLGDGFIADNNPVRQYFQTIQLNGSNAIAFLREVDITPIKAGQLALHAQAFTAGNQFTGPITLTGHAIIRGGPPEYVLVESEPVVLNVRPLPREGELPGFNGAIGHFKRDEPTLVTNVLRVGDAVTLTVNVRGDRDLTRLVAPPPPSAPGWQVFAGAMDPAPPQLIQTRGFISFSYTLIPTSEETRATPKFPFSYFDPDKAAYVDLSVSPVNVTVKPGTTPVDMAALTQAGAPTAEREREPKLSGLATTPSRRLTRLVPVQREAWFPLMQLAPAGAFLGLWLWDRRRRFYEAHPEILVRRRARRALRREWAAVRQAASLGDTSRFAACAVNAMRIACAPHYPAEPRALVSSDVAPLLDATHVTNGANVVRQIFAAADAERFAEQPEPAKDLLTLRGELEHVLTQLEARL